MKNNDITTNVKLKDKLTEELMHLIGLEVFNGTIVDQDTFQPIYFKQKFLTLDNTTKKGFTQFNILNPRFLIELLSYFSNKLTKEQGVPDIFMFHNIRGSFNKDGSKNKGQFIIKLSNNKEITSMQYYIDALQIIDTMFQLSGQSYVDLSIYDEKR